MRDSKPYWFKATSGTAEQLAEGRKPLRVLRAPGLDGRVSASGKQQAGSGSTKKSISQAKLRKQKADTLKGVDSFRMTQFYSF